MTSLYAGSSIVQILNLKVRVFMTSLYAGSSIVQILNLKVCVYDIIVCWVQYCTDT